MAHMTCPACLDSKEEFEIALTEHLSKQNLKHGCARNRKDCTFEVVDFVQGAKILLSDLGYQRIKMVMDSIQSCADVPSQISYAWTLCSLTGRPTQQSIVIDNVVQVCVSLQKWVCSVWVVTNMKMIEMLQKDSDSVSDITRSAVIDMYYKCFCCVVKSLQDTFYCCWDLKKASVTERGENVELKHDY